MRSSIYLLPLAAVAFVSCSVHLGEECTFKAHREAHIEAGGIRRVVIEAAAGDLRITGRPGATSIAATGEACAASTARLEEIQIHHELRGDTLHFWTNRDRGEVIRIGWDDQISRMDLTVELPTDLPLEVDDGSGDTWIKSVHSLVIEDGSGDLALADLLGNVRVEDGSGSVEILGVDGDIEIEDGSGEIEITGVKGEVVLEDGSGGVSIRQVGGSVDIREDGSGNLTIVGISHNVRIRVDGSGDIEVQEVSGNVDVEDDGSGAISTEAVAGQVSVPEGKRQDR
jgi:hypothetical protein